MYVLWVIRGCGQVELPLAIAFSLKGLQTSIYDTNEEAVEQVSRGDMPFMEAGRKRWCSSRGSTSSAVRVTGATANK